MTESHLADTCAQPPTPPGPIAPELRPASPIDGRRYRLRRLVVLLGALAMTVGVAAVVGGRASLPPRGELVVAADDGGSVVATAADGPMLLTQAIVQTASTLLGADETASGSVETAIVPTVPPTTTPPVTVAAVATTTTHTHPTTTTAATTATHSHPTTTTTTTTTPTTTHTHAPSTTSAPAQTSTQRAESGEGSGEQYAYDDPRSTQVWYDLADCEAGGDWYINSGNGYYGGLQFALASWQKVGGTGYPHEHPPETQIEMGRRLQAGEGWEAWPYCSRKLGLT